MEPELTFNEKAEGQRLKRNLRPTLSIDKPIDKQTGGGHQPRGRKEG